MVPLPVPVMTLTEYGPLPVTGPTLAPATPVMVRVKSLVSTPVTDWLKVTVKSTEGALVGLPLARTMEETVGAGEAETGAIATARNALFVPAVATIVVTLPVRLAL